MRTSNLQLFAQKQSGSLDLQMASEVAMTPPHAPYPSERLSLEG